MFYLKLMGRIVTVSVKVVNDEIDVDALRNGKLDISDGRGKEIFKKIGLLTDESFGYHLELVEIEIPQWGETFKKIIHPVDTSYFFVYPKPYVFNGNEYIVYTLKELTGSLYAEVDKLEYDEFNPEDFYVGELILDDDIGDCGIISEIYYIPPADAKLFADTNDMDRARSHIVSLLRDGGAKGLQNYKLRIDLGEEDENVKYLVVKNRGGELYNDWFTTSLSA